MTRDLRIEFENAFHHVINRGYHKMNIFHCQADFKRFINDLELSFESHTLVIHAYCLMNNHFHLFTETPHANLQQAMHKLQSRYASYYKAKYKHPGKVFEKRYKGILVDTDSYALDLTRYIHRNPVGPIVIDAASWHASSYRAYLGYDPKRKFLDTDLILNNFDTDSRIARQKMQKHVEREEGNTWRAQEFTNSNSILGSESFIERIQTKLPEAIDTEIPSLIQLKAKEKVTALKSYVSCLKLPARIQKAILLYGLRKKTPLKTDQINNVLGEDLSCSGISNRIKSLMKRSHKDKNIAKILIEINSMF